MKNIIKTLGILSIPFLCSCERELIQYSSVNESEETALSSPTAFRMAMDGVYSSMKQSYYYRGDVGSQIILGDLTTDNLVKVTAGRSSNAAASNFEFTPENLQTAGLYQAAYNVISKANFVLSHLDKGIVTGAEKESLEAEARAVRALAHFDLVRAYCKIPTQSADAKSSVGIYYSESFNPSNTENISRSLNVEQVYDKIIADLEFAQDRVPVTSSDKGRLTQAAVYGLLSRVYLYKGDYDNVIKNGEKSLSLAGKTLTNLSNFKSIWKSTNVDGVLFQVLNSEQEAVTIGVAYNQTLASGIRSEYVVDYDLYNLYTPDDIRKETYFTTGTYAGQKYNNVTKYTSIGGSPNVVPAKYLRTSEVALNVAEAYYKNKNEEEARKLLNDLRKQRYSGYVEGKETGDALINQIYLQRRLELAFENDRWYTLKRLGLSVERSGKGDFFDGTGEPAVQQKLEAGSYKWQWPIPLTAIQKNTSIVQNPGYTK